jgi:hypothetical protein
MVFIEVCLFLHKLCDDIHEYAVRLPPYLPHNEALDIALMGEIDITDPISALRLSFSSIHLLRKQKGDNSGE